MLSNLTCLRRGLFGYFGGSDSLPDSNLTISYEFRQRRLDCPCKAFRQYRNQYFPQLGSCVLSIPLSFRLLTALSFRYFFGEALVFSSEIFRYSPFLPPPVVPDRYTAWIDIGFGCSYSVSQIWKWTFWPIPNLDAECAYLFSLTGDTIFFVLCSIFFSVGGVRSFPNIFHRIFLAGWIFVIEHRPKEIS